MTVFRLEDLPEPSLRQGAINDFTIDGGGRVHLLTIARSTRSSQGYEAYGLEFRPDGQFESAIRLETGFFPSKIAAFPNGSLLVSGSNLRRDEEKGTVSGEPGTAIFDKTGERVSSMTLPGDVELGRPAALERREGAEREVPSVDPAAPINLGMAITGDDGNVYLMRASSKPLIYVISSAGTVIRRIVLTPPSGALRPGPIKVSNGKVAAEFVERNPDPKQADRYVYSLFDGVSGERIADFQPSPEAGGAFASYAREVFTFISARSGRWVLLRTAPK